MNEDKIDLKEWKFLISGGAIVVKDIPNPAPDWVNERSWKEILSIQVISYHAMLLYIGCLYGYWIILF